MNKMQTGESSTCKYYSFLAKANSVLLMTKIKRRYSNRQTFTCSSSSRTAHSDMCDGCGRPQMKLCSRSSVRYVPPQLLTDENRH